MTLRIGWLSPFSRRTGVGTFSKAITDAMPERHRDEAVDLTVVSPVCAGMYRTRHRFVDIASAEAGSGLYGLFDVLVCNIGNNTEHHGRVIEVLRHRPAIVICHDHVYQHYLATIVQDRGGDFADYVALNARYGRPGGLRTIRQSNLTRGRGLLYAPWDSEFSSAEPLGAPLLKLGAALVVHSRFAERYARACFQGPVLRLGMPHDQRPAPVAAGLPGAAEAERRPDGRMTIVSFGHVQATKCIDDVLRAMAASDELRRNLLYVISGFVGSRDYLNHLRALVEDLGLQACVGFELDLTDAELARLSATADAFVNLRYPNTEGASVSLVEQLATGKPVMVLDSGCYAELPDDAVIKVARPRDTGAIRDALLRMLANREALAEIGRRGRDHALGLDCRGYARGLLDFVLAQRALLARRSAVVGRRLVDVELPGPEDVGAAEDEAWLGDLAGARSTLDLLDRGCLALDPDLLRAIPRDAIADYVQAAILRHGTDRRLHAALAAYFADKPDFYRPVRLLHVMQRALCGDGQACASLPEICPHGDLAFWDVVRAMGTPVLATVLFLAFFRQGPGHHLLAPDEPGRASETETRIALEAQSAGRKGLGGPLAAELSHHLGALVAHLVASSLDEAHEVGRGSLEALPLGRSIAIGSPEQARYLRLSGFFDPESDHAWTGAGPGVVFLRPASGARRIVVTGYGLDSEGSVSFAAAGSFAASARQSPRPRGTPRDPTLFEIELEKGVEAGSAPLCLAIRSSTTRSPADLGLSTDARPLGFCLTRIAVA